MLKVTVAGWRNCMLTKRETPSIRGRREGRGDLHNGTITGVKL